MFSAANFLLLLYFITIDAISIETLVSKKISTVDRVRAEGYAVEEHYVQTSDGYILALHRIPRSKSNESLISRPPVFLQHGLLCSSSDWILSGPGKGLAYILSDAGYDVWMGNARGNIYSKNHAWLSTTSRKFWDFSWHEIGLFDISTMIDYVLAQTNHSALHYVGHSQGTTAFYVLTSVRPEYNRKIKSMHALGPVAFCSQMKSPFVRILAPFLNKGILADLLGKTELRPSSELLTKVSKVLCKDESIMQELCTNIVFLIAGFDSKNLNRTMIPDIISTVPAGSSVKQVVHFVQLFKSKQFRMFDYGLIKNKLSYGSFTPPNYDLQRITAPVALYYGNNDWFSGVADVQQLAAKLGNLHLNYRVPHDRWNHLDFLWGIDVKTLLYDTLLDTMRNFD